MAAKVGAELHAVVLAKDASALANAVKEFGVKAVHAGSAPHLEHYLAETYAPAVAELATLLKAEKGDPVVSFGVYATILFVLGLSDRITELADPRHDQVGLALEEERLPQRIRLKK